MYIDSVAVEKIGNLLLKFLPSSGPVRKCRLEDFVEAEDCVRLGVKVLHVDNLTIGRECATSFLILDRLPIIAPSVDNAARPSPRLPRRSARNRIAVPTGEQFLVHQSDHFDI